MKTKIFALILGLFCLFNMVAIGQTVSPPLSGFNGKVQFTGFTNNGLFIRGTLAEFLDQTNQYFASDIDTNDVAWDNLGRKYRVVAVISSNLTQAVVDMARVGGGSHFPSGVGMVNRETANGLSLVSTANSIGISQQLLSRILTNNFEVMGGMNTIYTGSDSVRVLNLLVKMAANGSQSLGIGELPSFPNRTYNYDETGLLLSRNSAGEVGLFNRKDYLTSYGDSWFITSNRRGAEMVINGASRSVDIRGSRFNGSFVILRVDSIGVNVLDQNGGEYRLALPSFSTPNIGSRSIMVWDGNGSISIPKFITSKNSVFTGTTNASGDLQIIIPSMPDDTYSVLITVEGTTSYTTSVHSKLSGNFKVRFFNPATGAPITSTSVSCSYKIEDY